MSTPTIEDRVRTLRKRIMKEIMKLPLYVMDAIPPISANVTDVVGKKLLAGYPIDYTLYVTDILDNIKYPSAVSLWQQVFPLQDVLNDIAGNYLKELAIKAPMIRFEWIDGYVKNIKADIWGNKCYTIDMSISVSWDIDTPPNINPVRPPYIKVRGLAYYAKAERDVNDWAEVIIVAGTVSVKQTDGTWATWPGVAIRANRVGTNVTGKVSVYTPHGLIELSSDSSQEIVKAEIMSAESTSAGWGSC